MKLGFAMLNNLEVGDSVAIGKRAEELGYDSVWFAEHNYSRDAVTACAALASVTDRVTIGPCVVPILTRSALLLANTFATLDEIAGGRMVLGLGAGSRVLIRGQGIEYRKPLVALREYAEACRAIWNGHGRHLNYEGEIVKLHEAELDFAPRRRRIPIWIGSTGPKACELAGEIGDGVMLNAFLPASYIRSAMGWLRTGAGRAGRSLGDGFDVSMIIITTVSGSKEEAHQFLRPMLAVYLARLPDVTRHTTVWPVYESLVAAVNEGGGEAGGKYVSDELIDDITICGTLEDCREGLARFVEAGLNHPVVVGFGDVRGTMEAMAPRA
ncbi:MAG TPA: LLM class flavin-dependent oxidoreductase [Actinomycetes bacterium]|jgi:5,10-methylenetetrahydromethanopterin reductase|nr:LLM class flavin-dependent oxidoreductase [Actinomycetes bacterium]